MNELAATRSLAHSGAPHWGALHARGERAYTYELALPDFQGADPGQVQAALGALASGLLVPHVRLLTYVRPIEAADFELELRRQKAQQRTALGHDYREEEARAMHRALRVPAWSMSHYVISWGQELLALHGLAREATPPRPLHGPYREHTQYLAPGDPSGHPVKLVGSYEFRPGTWTWWNPWADLVTQADGPQIICLDAVRIPETQVRLTRQGLRNMARAGGDVDEAQELAQIAQAALSRREPFYDLRLVVLLRDAREDRLLERAKRLKQLFGAQLALSLLDGQQAGALDFFTSRARPRLGGPGAHHPVLGSALPIAFGGVAGLVNRPQPRGIYMGFRIGLGAQNLGPVYMDPWHNERGELQSQAVHLGLLGASGKGKTVKMYSLLSGVRAALDLDIVLLEPLGNASKLADLLQHDPKLKHYQVTWDNVQINPLEYVGQNEGEQEDHFIGLMETMLRRELDNIERGVLMTAFRQVYAAAGCTREAMVDRPELAPRLVDLCGVLDELARSAPHDLDRDRAHFICRELDGLYVSGGYARVFNAPTNVDFSFDGATLYDLSGVSSGNARKSLFLTLFYYLALGGLMRTVRRRRARGERRPGVIALDEWFILSRNPYLQDLVVELVKTARNLQVSLWLAEQDLATFAGHEDAKGVSAGALTGHHLLNNIPYWLAFRHQSASEARLLQAQFPQRFSQGHAEFLAKAEPGECVALLDRTYQLRCILLPSERRALLGEGRVAEPSQVSQEGGRQ